jgi:lipoyl(octanoyl) transferase
MTAAAVQTQPFSLRVRWLGRRDYAPVLAEQEALLAAVLAGEAAEQVLLVEHPPVYTLGRGADAADLRGAPERLGVPVHRVGRGGGATFHGPGQLIAYPIVRLRSGGRDVHGYVRTLERALIATAAAFGVTATTREGEPGIWVAERKLGSIGIGVRRGVAYHGIALNIATDLSYFDAIVVCRSDQTAMVNLGELVVAPSLRAAGDAFAAALASELGLIPAAAPAGEGRGGGTGVDEWQ